MRQAIITFDDGERVLITLHALTSRQVKYPDRTERQIVEGFNLALPPGGAQSGKGASPVQIKKTTI